MYVGQGRPVPLTKVAEWKKVPSVWLYSDRELRLRLTCSWGRSEPWVPFVLAIISCGSAEYEGGERKKERRITKSEGRGGGLPRGVRSTLGLPGANSTWTPEVAVADANVHSGQ